MDIAIVGAGAMGSLFTYLLHKGGYNPWLLDKYQKRVDFIKKEGLTVEVGGTPCPIALTRVTSDPEEIGIVDLILIFVKSYDTEGALRGAVSLIGNETVVVTLQNGLGNLERIASMVGEKRAIAGTTAHGATYLGWGHIRHAGFGDTIIGSQRGQQVGALWSIKKIFDASGIETTITDNLEEALWGKLIINAAINPLTALTQLSNGELLEYGELLELQARIVEEGSAVARARRVTIDPAHCLEKLREVCRLTAFNKSSMLQDVLHKKRTEIDYINGAIVNEAGRHTIPVPYNEAMVKLVKALEIQNLNL